VEGGVATSTGRGDSTSRTTIVASQAGSSHVDVGDINVIDSYVGYFIITTHTGACAASLLESAVVSVEVAGQASSRGQRRGASEAGGEAGHAGHHSRYVD
jgi:hypothetical protein